MRLALFFTAALLSASVHAAGTTDAYRVRTADELARVCGATPSDPEAATALAFCHGVLAGAYGYYVAVTPVERRFVCVPNPGPNRAQIANGFVEWLKKRPNLASDGAIDALFRYAEETFPCKP